MNLNELEIAAIKRILGSMPSDGWSQLTRDELAREATGMDYGDSYAFANKCIRLGIGDASHE